VTLVVVGVSDERSAAVQHDEPSLFGQLLFSPADHVPAHAVLLGHVEFAGQSVIDGQSARADFAEHVVVDLLPQKPWGAVADAVSLVWQ
jgi:hypothetical protein